MNQIDIFEKIRVRLDEITAISNKLASDITENDLAHLYTHSFFIYKLLDYIESKMKKHDYMNHEDYVRMVSDYFLDIRKHVSSISHVLNKKPGYITENDIDLMCSHCIDIWDVMNDAEEELREEE